MSDFKSPITAGTVTAADGSVAVADETATAKIVVRAAAGTLVCGTRPDEWTLFAGLERAGELAASIDTTGFVSVLDITHGRAMIRVSGPKAAKVLEKVCNVDLSDDMTPDGAVFSASVAKVTCDLLRADRGGEPSYLISCERSFGDYVYAALADACTEFGATLPAGLGIH
jgi:heterotetrameric sarcosine oxidase gamma subunit